MDFSVSLPLVASGELAAAVVASERLLSCVCANVRSEVVTAAEVAHTDPALKRLVSSVDPDVSRQFI